MLSPAGNPLSFSDNQGAIPAVVEGEVREIIKRPQLKRKMRGKLAVVVAVVTAVARGTPPFAGEDTRGLTFARPPSPRPVITSPS